MNMLIKSTENEERMIDYEMDYKSDTYQQNERN